MRLACVWWRMVFRTSCVPGILRALASTLPSNFLAAGLRVGACRTLEFFFCIAFSSPVMSRYLPQCSVPITSLAPSAISSFVSMRREPRAGSSSGTA